MIKETLVVAFLLAASAVFAEQSPATPLPPSAASSQVSAPTLTRFDLDFPGGTPRQLIDAIEKRSGRPVNAIILTEYADQKLPPLKMRNVTVADLFRALEQTAVMRYSGNITGAFTAAFRRTGTGEITDDTIWSFFVQSPDTPAMARFYSLAPFLERGLTVDDITTAIQTAWKMRGEDPLPKLSFHQETKLLIVVGEPLAVNAVELALTALQAQVPRTAAAEKGGATQANSKPKG